MARGSFRRPVGGFCYPFDAWNDAVRHAVRAAGYRFARGNALGRADFPPADPFTFHPQCHFLSNHFWTLYEEARRDDAVFFFWGHSYELVDEMMWLTLEGMYERISSDLDATWVSIPSLFAV